MSDSVRKHRVAAVLLAAALVMGLSAALSRPQPASAAGEDAAPSKGKGKAKKGRAASATFEVYQDRRGEHRWRLRAQNRQILATSGEGYQDKSDCLNSIESVKRAAADAPVVEQEEPGAGGEEGKGEGAGDAGATAGEEKEE